MIRRRAYIKRSTKRSRRERKTPRATLKRRCDKLWSLIIRASNGGRCKLQGKDHVRCGGVLQAAHCFGRGHNIVRHELWNGWPICAGHHVYYTNNPEAWGVLLMAEWGPEIYAERWISASTLIGRPDYQAIAVELAQALAQVA
jgi:hypothetical protein